VPKVAVFAPVRAAILTTGDELVPAGTPLRPGQIYNSNGIALAAVLGADRVHVVSVQHSTDDPAVFTRLLAAATASADVVFTSGGVSKGDFEVVKEVLAARGGRFGSVAMQPGGPQGVSVVDGVPVLSFPGNPVSTLVCFELFVRPTIATLAGRADERREPVRARLAIEHAHRGDRPTYFPAALETDGTATGADYQVRPLAWKGSADLCTLTEANSLAYFPPGTRLYGVGEPVDVWPLE